MKILDYFIVALIFLSAFFCFFHKQDKQKMYLYIKTPKATNTYSMDIDKKITNVDPLRKFVISISNKKATINFISCQKRISIQQESINEMNHSVICISNLLEANIISSNEKNLDAFSIQSIYRLFENKIRR